MASSIFEIVCSCSQLHRGKRSTHYQLFDCPRCGQRLFVLPSSPFRRVASSPPSHPNMSWYLPLLVAFGVILLVLISFSLLLPLLTRKEGIASVDESAAYAEQLNPELQLNQGRQSLAQGRFRVAREQFELALRQGAASTEAVRLARQAELLALLSTHSLEEIAIFAMLVRDPEEWAKQFADYRGRAFLFDAIVHRDKHGNPVFAHYSIELENQVIRIALEDIEALRDLPLEDHPRLIFGARLASFQREKGGDWVVRFFPDSGILMTDLAAVEASFISTLDADVQPILARQARWLEARKGLPQKDHQEK